MTETTPEKNDNSLLNSNDITSCLKSLIQNDSSSHCSSLSFISPGGNLSSLSIDFSELSIDKNDDPGDVLHSTQLLKSPFEDFQLPSNISKVRDESNISIAYSISFDEGPCPEIPVYSPNTKRKLKSTPNLSTDSGYSPLAKNILNVSSTKKAKSRYSEFFRNELSTLGISMDKKSIESLSDDEISFGNFSDGSNKLSLELSIDDSNKENVELSIDNSTTSSAAKTKKSARFSEFFRSEVSQLNLESPGISLDSLNISSKNNSHLSIESLPSDCDNVNDSKTSNIEDIHDVEGTPEDDGLDSSSEEDINIKSKVTNMLEESDSEEELNLTKHVKSKTQILVSSDDEESDHEDIEYYYNEEDDVDDMGDFIVDDDVVEYDEGGRDSDVEGDASWEEDHANDDVSDANNDVASPDDSDDDRFITPPTSFKPPKSVDKKSIYHTPKATGKDLPNVFKTPTSLCHPHIGTNDRRRTAIATPLSVKSKIGTPSTPNKSFNRNIMRASHELFEQFNEFVFGRQLPADLEIKINKRLNTTAGRCVYLRKGTERMVYVELSPKVVDCLERLKETLAHELCHAATFIIDQKMDNHGPIWRKWAKRVNEKYPELPPVSRCHSYEINYKYTYSCSESWCNYTIGRYTRSVDLERARCPLCFSKLVLPESAAKNTKTPNKWTDFVKSNFNKVKQDNPATPHKDLMKLLSSEFKDMKVQKSA